MPGLGSDKGVVVDEVVDREDGRLEVRVVFGEPTSRRLKKLDADSLPQSLATAFRKAVVGLPGGSKRIVAYVPRSLAEQFEKLCHDEGSNMSHTILARISRYVDEDGEVLIKGYRKAPAIQSYIREEKQKKSIQVLAPSKQVEGFKRFRRSVGIKSDTFFMREMLRFIDKAAKPPNKP